MTDWAISQPPRGPFSRMNWDSPASVSYMTTDGPVDKTDRGVVVLFGCGCASWATFANPDEAVVPKAWEGARLVPFVRHDGRLYDVDGVRLPSWTSCTHGGTA